ncbi:MAG: hypothetical protein HWE20_16400 [Gammaproteobacteria bacterium]|nr:hypothetical protein [Gammaproteobacteria bacterium]
MARIDGYVSSSVPILLGTLPTLARQRQTGNPPSGLWWGAYHRVEQWSFFWSSSPNANNSNNAWGVNFNNNNRNNNNRVRLVRSRQW